MAGHSEWANRKHRKKKQDKKKAKIFGKYSRKIASAAREGGGDPEENATLRNLIDRAKDAEMPKDTIERAIKRGTGELEDVTYEDRTYEGYGPGGIAVMVETTTDNTNRTVAELRKIFDDFGGEIGEPGCVAYQFEQHGRITVPQDDADELELFDAAVEARADDVHRQGNQFEILTPVRIFTDVQEALEDQGYNVDVAELTYRPDTTVPVSDDDAEKLLELLDELDDHDDVTDVYSNFEMDEACLDALEGAA
jgi:YebC/PmpR family DNA-binding regulatory protein